MKPKDRARVKRLESLQGLAGSGGGGGLPGGTGLVEVTGGVGSTLTPVKAGNVVTDTGVGFASQPLARAPLSFTTFFIDPSNSTGFANDANPGTALLPILTTAHLNALLFLKKLVAGTTITYMSDDLSSVGLDLSTLDLGEFNLDFLGTPVVVHTGGNLNAGTITINPVAAGGGQRQTAHTTDLVSFAPFIFTVLGGASPGPRRLVDTVTGAGAWIVSGVATASMTRPVAPDGSAGALTIGDAYRIQRGSILELDSSSAPSSSGGVVSFSDFEFIAESVGPISLTNAIGSGVAYNRCAFLGQLSTGGNFSDCAICAGTSGSYTAIFSAGLWIPDSSVDIQTGIIAASGDIYVTGPTLRNLVIGTGFVQAMWVFTGIGAGLQVQDSTDDGLTVRQGGGLLCDVLIWGRGNTGYGLKIGTTTSTTIGAVATPPSITGALGDFAFEAQSVAVAVARAWNDTTGAYTEAGGPATRATTWANFVAAIGGGGFDHQAHCVQSGSTLTAD
jgi:hypothetical protein